MDSTHFDGITRDFAGSTTRRQTLRTLAAAGLGLGITRLGLSATEAAKGKGKGKKKGVTERCKKSDQCGGGLSCKPANSQNFYPETEKRCCKPVGAKCDDGIECCGIDVICNGGYCSNA